MRGISCILDSQSPKSSVADLDPDVCEYVVVVRPVLSLLPASFLLLRFFHALIAAFFRLCAFSVSCWHGYHDERTRQGTLERCAAGLGVDHVLNVVKWVRNSWPKHPTHYVHSEAVKRDYLWFEKSEERSLTVGLSCQFTGMLRESGLVRLVPPSARGPQGAPSQ